MERLQLLLRSPQGSLDTDHMRAVVDALAAPADGRWLLARIASLLGSYYEKNTPQAIREMEAEDWAAALASYPVWAVNLAVRWWKGPENASRSRRPLEGDIVARANKEMDAVRAAQIHLRRLESGAMEAAAPAEERRIATPEQRAAIMLELGFKPKGFGGELEDGK